MYRCILNPSRTNIDTTYIKEHPRSKGVGGVDFPFLFAPDASNIAVSHQDVLPYPGVDMQGYAVGRTLHKVDGKPAAQICKCNAFTSQSLHGHILPHSYTPVCIFESIASEDKSSTGEHFSWDQGAVGNRLKHKRNI